MTPDEREDAADAPEDLAGSTDGGQESAEGSEEVPEPAASAEGAAAACTEEALAGATERVAEVEARLAEVEAQLEVERQNHLRALADLENFRRRSAKEGAERVQRAKAEVLTSLLAVVDNVERAIEAIDRDAASEGEVATIVEGVRLIHAALLDGLGKHGVKPMEAMGTDFDPAVHDAVMQEASNSVDADCVSRVLETGYWIGESVLRPAKVAVSTGRAET